LMNQPDFMTWDQWHGNTPLKNGEKLKNDWSENLIKANDYVNNEHKDILPKPAAIVAAMQRLKYGGTTANETPNPDQAAANYQKMCKVSTGAVWGIIHVLDTYWSDTAKANMQFPYPAMGGTGDRMSICWAVFGKVPDLSVGLEVNERRKPKTLYHACQGLAAINPSTTIKPGANDCAEVAIYHTCKGSNLCKAEGGCGFIQPVGGGSSCGASTSFGQSKTASKGSIVTYSPPGDNACGGLGGCAVPMSASQLFPAVPPEGQVTCGFPRWGKMDLNDFKVDGDEITSIPIISNGNRVVTTFSEGNGVYDRAWESLKSVLKHRDSSIEVPEEMPEPNDIRLAFPPST